MRIQTTKSGMGKSLAQYIRYHTREGEELVDAVLGVMRGIIDGKKNQRLVKNIGLRMDAVAWLADRGWGKPPQHLAIDINDGVAHEALAQYTTEQIERLLLELPEHEMPLMLTGSVGNGEKP